MDWQYIVIIIGIIFAGLTFYQGYVRLRQQRAQLAAQQEISATQQALSNVLQELNNVAAAVVEQVETANADLQGLLAEIEAKKAELTQLLARAEDCLAAKDKSATNALAQSTGSFQPFAQNAAGLPKYQEVYRLATQGLSVAEIARTTQIGVGEVELVLNLYSQYRQ